MESEQAKILLSAYRPGRDEADPLLKEALALAARDPELGAWLAAQQAGDETARAALRSVTPPAHLREAILASAKTVPFPLQRSSRLPIWLAAAAAIMLALGVSFYFATRSVGTPFAMVMAAVPAMTAAHEHPFATDGGDTAPARSWLAAHGGPSEFPVPPGLRGAKEVGCEIASIGTTKVAIVCFDMPNGPPVHLYIVDRKQISQPPPMHSPAMSQDGEYAMASWSDDKNSYVLAENGTTEELQRLL